MTNPGVYHPDLLYKGDIFMRCRNCGQALENGSRFCTYCDCDNYPEMNRVKTKNTHYATSNRTVQSAGKYRPMQNNNSQSKKVQQNKSKKTNSGIKALIILFIIAYLLIMMMTGNFFD